MTALLEVAELAAVFHTRLGDIHAVRGISYTLNPGESLAIVGESGSGKSVGALSLLGLVPTPGEITGGRIMFRDRDLRTLPAKDLQKVRGRDIGMVFQDPMTSLNPVLTIGYQLMETLRWHLDMNKADARKRVLETLDLVGIPNATDRLADYPHQFSGGQRQRIMIAMAVVCRPALLIADEPTTALDVTIQAQIVELIKQLQQRLGMAVIWITHDLALVAGIVDRVAVMYAGSFVEYGPVDAIFTAPAHPYTNGLLRSMPRFDQPDQDRLESIEGSPPNPRTIVPGCPFAPRCPVAIDKCGTQRPALESRNGRHSVACWNVSS